MAWPRSKKEAPAASPVQDTTTTSKEDDFDLEKFLRYVLVYNAENSSPMR